ncbi:hypothetical protein [Kitasatospora fiedleri]|uniref:hypothetical protein n=1 Tax=Kitasatospora fiedleri TaxID=2991545 RepID=UPI00249B5976|nr:hypothetical protein [Kitasatospora fiedleri]
MTTDRTLPLDENTVAELARVVTGDDDLYYRKGYEIEGFLRRAGWQDVPAYDGQYRREWALELLMERRDRRTRSRRCCSAWPTPANTSTNPNS